MASYKVAEIQNIKIVIFCVLTVSLHVWPIIYYMCIYIYIYIYTYMVKGFFIFSLHMAIFYIMIFLDDIVLCLSIILK